MTRPNVGAWFRRNSMTIAIVILVCSFGTILFLQAEATSKLQEQTKQQAQIIQQIHDVTDQIAASNKTSTEQINQLNRHLDCIVIFFSQGDRATRSIADIDTCTLKSNANGTTTNPLGSTGVLNPTPQSTNNGAKSAQNTNGGGNGQTPPPSGGSSQPSFLDQITTPITRAVDGITNFIKGL